MATPPTTNPTSAADDPVPLALWPVAQQTSERQLPDLHSPDGAGHPDATRLELARRIVTEYSRPGDLVLDPHCGAGTTLVAVAALGRRAIGLAGEDRWARLAIGTCERVLALAEQARVEVITADSGRLAEVLGDRAGTVDLAVVTSSGGGHAIEDRAVVELYARCRAVLKPGGLLVVVTTQVREGGRLVDRAGTAVAAAQQARFVYLQHVIALTAPIRDGQLLPIRSAPASAGCCSEQGDGEQGQRGQGHRVVHDDVLVFQAPTAETGPGRNRD